MCYFVLFALVSLFVLFLFMFPGPRLWPPEPRSCSWAHPVGEPEPADVFQQMLDKVMMEQFSPGNEVRKATGEGVAY